MNSIQIIKSQLKHVINNPKDYGLISAPYFLVAAFSDPFFGLPIWLTIILYIFTTWFLVVSTHRLVIINDRDFFNFNKEKISSYLKYIYSGFIFSIFIFIPIYFIVVFDGIISNPYVSPFSSEIGVTLFVLTFFVGSILALYIIGAYSLNLPKAAIGESVKFLKMRKESKGFRINIILQFIIIIFPLWILEYVNIEFNSNLFFQIFISALLITLNYGLTISCISKTYVIFSKKNKEE